MRGLITGLPQRQQGRLQGLQGQGQAHHGRSPHDQARPGAGLARAVLGQGSNGMGQGIRQLPADRAPAGRGHGPGRGCWGWLRQIPSGAMVVTGALFL